MRFNCYLQLSSCWIQATTEWIQHPEDPTTTGYISRMGVSKVSLNANVWLLTVIQGTYSATIDTALTNAKTQYLDKVCRIAWPFVDLLLLFSSDRNLRLFGVPSFSLIYIFYVRRVSKCIFYMLSFVACSHGVKGRAMWLRRTVYCSVPYSCCITA